jgi:hypothetical protein
VNNFALNNYIFSFFTFLIKGLSAYICLFLINQYLDSKSVYLFGALSSFFTLFFVISDFGYQVKISDGSLKNTRIVYLVKFVSSFFLILLTLIFYPEYIIVCVSAIVSAIYATLYQIEKRKLNFENEKNFYLIISCSNLIVTLFSILLDHQRILYCLFTTHAVFFLFQLIKKSNFLSIKRFNIQMKSLMQEFKGNTPFFIYCLFSVGGSSIEVIFIVMNYHENDVALFINFQRLILFTLFTLPVLFNVLHPQIRSNSKTKIGPYFIISFLFCISICFFIYLIHYFFNDIKVLGFLNNNVEILHFFLSILLKFTFSWLGFLLLIKKQNYLRIFVMFTVSISFVILFYINKSLNPMEIYTLSYTIGVLIYLLSYGYKKILQ